MIYTFKHFRIDTDRRELTANGNPVRMRPRCFDALVTMVRRPEQVITKDDFHRAIWPGEAVSDASLTQLMYELRQTLGDAEGALIATIPKLGYRFNAPVRAVPEASTAQYLERFEAYELCARARVLLEGRGSDAFHKARELFTEAIDKSPGYAPAHLGLAEAWSWLAAYLYVAPGEAFPVANTHVSRALELDPKLSAGYGVLAQWALMYEWNWARAEELAGKAIAINAIQELPYQILSWLYLIFGRFDDALVHVARGLDAFPTSLNLHASLGIIYAFQGNPAKAAQLMRSLLDVNPRYNLARYNLGNALAIRPETLDEAIAELTALSEVDPSVQNWSSLAYALGEAGRESEARRLIGALTERAERGEYVENFSLALASTGLHELDTAMEQLEKAVDARAPRLIFVNVDPRFQKLHEHARFPALIKRVGLKQ